MTNSGAKELLYFEAPKGKRQALSGKVADQIEVRPSAAIELEGKLFWS